MGKAAQGCPSTNFGKWNDGTECCPCVCFVFGNMCHPKIFCLNTLMMIMIMYHPNGWGGIVVGMVLWLGGMVNVILWEWTCSRNTLSLGGWHPALTQMARLGLNPFCSNSCHHPLSSEYVIPQTLIALALRKPTKTQQNQSKSNWVHLVFLAFLKCFWSSGGIIVGDFFAKKTPNKQALDDILRDTHSCCVVLGAFHGSQIDIHIYIYMHLHLHLHLHLHVHTCIRTHV